MDNQNILDVNQDDFESKVIDESVKKLIVVDFWAPWCGPCKQLTPVLEKVIKNSGNKVTLVKINIDENQQIAAQLRIQSIPTVYAFKDKQIVNAFQGVLPEKQIVEFLEKCLGSKIGKDFDLSFVFKYANIFFSGESVGSFGLPFDASFLRLLCRSCLAI